MKFNLHLYYFVAYLETTIVASHVFKLSVLTTLNKRLIDYDRPWPKAFSSLNFSKRNFSLNGRMHTL